MAGGQGNDIYYVNAASDVVHENAGQGADRLYTKVSFALEAAADIETLYVTSTAGVSLTGSSRANAIYGFSGADTLNGADGADVLDGKGGSDSLVGGAGNDKLYVDSLGDRVLEAAGGGTDYVYASGTFTLDAGQEIEYLYANAGPIGLILTGNELVNRIYGRDGGDTLSGAGGNDQIYGQAGADRLVGGTGLDALTGGAGSDTFVLANLAASRDTLADFVSGADHLEISAALFGGGLAPGALAASQLAANTTGLSSDNDDRFVYNTTSGALYYDSDGTGIASRELIASLTHAPHLSASDFFIVA